VVILRPQQHKCASVSGKHVNTLTMVKIFKYLEELDCFVVDPNYKTLAHELGLVEWHETVWIGRFFTLDNDYGEHWFDNWDLREALELKAKTLGLDSTELFILDPDRFKNNVDGPCHDDAERVRFWKDVLNSLQLSHETIFAEARRINAERKELDPEDFVADLEDRINKIKNACR
jgi:hypothetical protein